MVDGSRGEVGMIAIRPTGGWNVRRIERSSHHNVCALYVRRLQRPVRWPGSTYPWREAGELPNPSNLARRIGDEVDQDGHGADLHSAASGREHVYRSGQRGHDLAAGAAGDGHRRALK
jgi:hypothetical protein